jgi:hypothetical protein
MLVVASSAGQFDHSPAVAYLGGFPGEASLFGGPAGWGAIGGGPINRGWNGPGFTPIAGPDWMRVMFVFRADASPSWMTMDGPTHSPWADPPGSTGVSSTQDSDPGMDPSLPGGPMASVSGGGNYGMNGGNYGMNGGNYGMNGGNYGGGPNSSVTPFASISGPGGATFILKVDYTPDPAPFAANAPPPAPSSFTPDRGHLEASEPGMSQAVVVGVLVANNQQGPQMMSAPGASSANQGLGASASSAGNAPLQARSLLGAGHLGADQPASTNPGMEELTGLANARAGRVSGPRGHSSSPVPIDHAALRPASDFEVPDADRPVESVPSPLGADLIVEGLPMARESLEAALSQFVRQLDDLDAALLDVRGPGPIVAFSLSLLSAAASAEMARRYVRRKSSAKRGVLAVDPSGRQLTLGFPELPRSWSERRA